MAERLREMTRYRQSVVSRLASLTPHPPGSPATASPWFRGSLRSWAHPPGLPDIACPWFRGSLRSHLNHPARPPPPVRGFEARFAHTSTTRLALHRQSVVSRLAS